MRFGERLTQMRKARKVTQKQLGSRLEMDTAYLSRIENDYIHHTPSRETIERIVRALDLSEGESDELHALAGKIPADVEKALLSRPQLLLLVRNAEAA